MINIDKNTAKINDWDKEYLKLIRKIIEEGKKCENRTGINTISIPGYSFSLQNVEENFPILESKKIIMKNALSEILWIHQAQSNDVNWLEERGNNIWQEWKIDDDGIYRIYEPNINGNEDKEVYVKLPNGCIYYDPYGDEVTTTSKINGRCLKDAIYYGEDWKGTIGTAYGWINNKFNRPQYVLNSLKNNKNDRRMVISLWQDEYIQTGTLPPCVWSTEWKVDGDTLNCFVHQRSADVPLGLPFNVSQYAALLCMFAKVSGLKAGTLNYSIMDAHIYDNQIDGIIEQIKRYNIMQECEDMINTKPNIEIFDYYTKLTKDLLSLRTKAQKKKINLETFEEYNKILEKFNILQFMITKKKPVLKLADKDNFFDFSNEVNNDKEYLKENSTGNEDIKLLNYSSLPFIKMPITQ